MQGSADLLGKHEKNVPNDAEEENATVVITVTAVDPVLVEDDNFGNTHVLGNVDSLPPQIEELLQMLQ